MSFYAHIKLYIHTIKYLKPSQVFYRVYYRAIRQLYRRRVLKIRIPGKIKINDNVSYLIPELDFDKDFLSRFNINDILSDKFKFINISYDVELDTAWNNQELQHLWRYNLHYYDYFFMLAYEYSNNNNKQQFYSKYKYFIEKWIENNYLGVGDGWHPYTISLRLTNWIVVYNVFKDSIDKDIRYKRILLESIYCQYQYLKKVTEKDVLGNHYFENIKALIICSLFFGEHDVTQKYKKQLLRQLDEQILSDGMHFELSPMYHKIILEDLIKIAYWLREDKIYNDLLVFIQKMINVSYSLEQSFGKIPFFNDSSDGISKGYQTLIHTAKKYFKIKPEFTSDLEDSGFYILCAGNKKLIFDCGEICPSYLPAHGHCDALSYELSVNNRPLIVNLGTYTYEKGKWRNYFRSTQSHNTVVIEDNEQSQFWGSFRVAKRIRDVRKSGFKYRNILFYVGSYVTYKGHQHKRIIGFIDENAILILDYIKEGLNANSYIHFTPEVQINIIDNNTAIVNSEGDTITISAFNVDNIKTKPSWYSRQFNLKEVNTGLKFEKDISSNYFGYLIGFNSNISIYKNSNHVMLIKDKEIIVDCNVLGGIL